MLTHYDLLGVSETADETEIRKAFRTMSKKHHPDLNEGKASPLYSAVSEAYEVLSNAKSRKAYDEKIKAPGWDGTTDDEESAPSAEYTPRDTGASTRPRANAQTTTDTPGGVRQVKVQWSDYDWYKAEHPESTTVINPRPHVLHRGLIVLGYWVSLVLSLFFILLALGSTSFAPMLGFLLGLLGVVAGALMQYGNREGFGWKWSSVHFLWAAGTIAWQVAADTSATGLGIASLGATMVLSVLSGIWGQKVESERVWMSTRPVISRKDAADYFQWGSAGNLGDAVGKFGQDNVAKGVAGEKYTEKLFQELSKIPSVRIFHGLKFPGSEKADLDHAILAGDTLIFVDSKQWSPGTYSFSNVLGSIEQVTGDEIYTRTTNFNRAVNGYRWLMPKRVTVYGVMLIHGDGVVVDQSADSQDGIRMMGTREGMEVIGKVCAEAANHVDLRVLNTLANNLKA